jgi:hypothetical protein
MMTRGSVTLRRLWQASLGSLVLLSAGCFGVVEKPADLDCTAEVNFTLCDEGARLVTCIGGVLTVTVCEEDCVSGDGSATCSAAPVLTADGQGGSDDTSAPPVALDTSGPTEADDTSTEEPESDVVEGPLTGCELDNGGCDPMTACGEGPSGIVCGPCPVGYSVDAAGACADACAECEAPTPVCLQGGGCGACQANADCAPGRSCDQATYTCTGCNLFDQTGCGDNQVCTLVYTDGGQSYEGVCSDGNSPPGQPGEYCNPVQCRHGALCQQDIDSLYRCRSLCEPSAQALAPGACGVDEQCIPLMAEVGGALEEEPLGSCRLPCEPFSEAALCPEGYWCSPDIQSPAFNRPDVCVASVGTVGPNAACEPSFVEPETTTCAPDTLCFQGECRVLCDSDLAPCEEGGCNEFADGTGEFVVFSLCQMDCDYDAGTACPDPAQTCIPATVFDEGSEGGTCINTPSDPQWPYDEFETCSEVTGLCAPFSYCIDYAGFPGSTGFQCYELCRFSEGAKNTVNHPDCSRSTALCEDILGAGLGTTSFGVCGHDI